MFVFVGACLGRVQATFNIREQRSTTSMSPLRKSLEAELSLTLKILCNVIENHTDIFSPDNKGLVAGAVAVHRGQICWLQSWLQFLVIVNRFVNIHKFY